ncbi:response regulator transcription factor [Xanthobacter sp. AM11]|uniref:response regulator transcription factor n=1 Tax=Xanthobacter sp. AM11 TaxID=3380643 RepID=UPI0039BF351D
MSDPTPAATILVVDGDILVRHVIADYLRSCGYTVLEAASGEEARALLATEAARIDVVLADAGAQGAFEGFALAHWLRQAHPRIKIVLAGAPVMAAAQASALCDDGPQVGKPYQPQQVVDRIRWLMARRDRHRP